MREEQERFYHEMIEADRGYLVIREGKLAGLVVFFIGDDDNKYIHGRDPWTMLIDEPFGSTVYIDQLLTTRATHAFFREEAERFYRFIVNRFPNVDKVKWARAPVRFRKQHIRGGKPNVYCKSIERSRVRQAAV